MGVWVLLSSTDFRRTRSLILRFENISNYYSSVALITLSLNLTMSRADGHKQSLSMTVAISESE
jgi:hypothetical protein